MTDQIESPAEPGHIKLHVPGESFTAKPVIKRGVRPARRQLPDGEEGGH